jgi:hypothetical protein
MRAQRYRRYALECLLLANRSDAPLSNVALLDMARFWARLADQAEKNSQLDLVYETPPRPSHGMVPDLPGMPTASSNGPSVVIVRESGRSSNHGPFD